MITRNGYSKDPGIRPDGIVITWGDAMIADGGGPELFCRAFERVVKSDTGWWVQKQRNKPTIDIMYVYIILGGYIKYRAMYGGHCKGPIEIERPNGKILLVDWNHIIITGPIAIAPPGMKLRGFQGFRYCTELF